MVMQRRPEEADPLLVTVVIPAFNAEATLAETLESVAAQTYKNLEILIIDDGSTDRTAEIAAAFCVAQGGRAKLIRKANGGVASARNLGLRGATGGWVAPIDADDLWHPTKIAKQVETLSNQSNLPGFIYCSFHTIDREGAVFCSPRDNPPAGNIFHRHAYENFVGNGSGLMLQREVALAVGGFDEGMPPGCADLMLQLKIARDWPVGCVPEHLVGYRVLPNAMSRDVDMMTKSWAVVLDWLSRNAPALPKHVVRWAKGMRYFEEAEIYALEGQWRSVLPRLAFALWLDPARCGLLTSNRALRLATKPFRMRTAKVTGPRFAALDPAEPLAHNPARAGVLTPLLDRLHRRRLKKLAEMDQAAIIST